MFHENQTNNQITNQPINQSNHPPNHTYVVHDPFTKVSSAGPEPIILNINSVVWNIKGTLREQTGDLHSLGIGN